MHKYEDHSRLEAIKQWVFSEVQQSANSLAKELDYDDLRRIAPCLNKIKTLSCEQRGLAILKAAEELKSAKNLSPNIFRTIADYVFDLKRTPPAMLVPFLSEGDKFSQDLWSELLTFDPGMAQTLSLPDFQNRLVEWLHELKKKRFEGKIIAAATIYFAHLHDRDSNAGSESMKKSVGVPILEAMNLPSSDSSISRFASGIEEVISRISANQRPVSIHSPEFPVWWQAVIKELKERCAYGAQGFQDVRELLLSLPGFRYAIEADDVITEVKQLPQQKDLDTSKSKKSAQRLELSERISLEAEGYKEFTPKQKKSTINRRLKKVYSEALFFSQIGKEELDDETSEAVSKLADILPILEKKIQITKTKKVNV